MLDSASIRNQAMQYVLNSADTVRATRYDDLKSSALAQVGSTRFYRSVTVENDTSAIDKKIATIKVFASKDDANLIAEMVVNKSRISEVLYDTIGNHTDGAMTQEASTRLFALVDNVFSKDEAYQTFITQSRVEALLKALEDAVADEYLSKTDADNIYRKIADSYSKGQTDSLLDALKAQVSVNKTNIAVNGSNISSISSRLKTMEDAMSLYLKIKDAADIYLTQTVAASTYATKPTAVTHVANTAVGSSTRPVYVDANGNAKALSGTVGSATEPIYLKDGVFTKTSGGGGSGGNNLVLSICSSATVTSTGSYSGHAKHVIKMYCDKANSTFGTILFYSGIINVERSEIYESDSIFMSLNDGPEYPFRGIGGSYRIAGWMHGTSRGDYFFLFTGSEWIGINNYRVNYQHEPPNGNN